MNWTWIGGFSGKGQMAFEALDAERDGEIDVAWQEEAELVAGHVS